MDPLVVVTGASGYLATHVVQQLQQAGYRVRGTVRSLQNATKVKVLQNLCTEAAFPLELVEADLLKPEDWLQAIGGSTYVIHVASPVPIGNPKHEDDVIRPAVEGTLNVLKAAEKAGTVRRVVLTSSFMAVSDMAGGERSYTEQDWTDITKKQISPYTKSKVLAETAAWDFIKELPNENKFELAVLNPAFIIGPALCGVINISMTLVKDLLERRSPILPRLNFPMVDVSDVAKAHLKAMTLSDAAGGRHLLVTQNLWMAEIAHICREEFQGQGYNVPVTYAPNWLLRFGSIFDGRAAMILPSLDKITTYETIKMQNVLGMEQMRDIKESILETCYSMIEAGFIRKSPQYKGKPLK